MPRKDSKKTTWKEYFQIPQQIAPPAAIIQNENWFPVKILLLQTQYALQFWYTNSTVIKIYDQFCYVSSKSQIQDFGKRELKSKTPIPYEILVSLF